MAPGTDEAQPGKVPLAGAVLVREGDRIPEMTLPSTAGGLVDLAARNAANHLVLFFYPGDGTGLRFPELLSNANRALVNTLGLPVWSDDAGAAYVSRVTLVVARGGRIARLFPEVKVEGHIQEVLGVLAG